MKRTTNVKTIIGAILVSSLFASCGSKSKGTKQPVQVPVAWTEEQKNEAIEFYSETAVFLDTAEQNTMFGECIFDSFKDRMTYDEWNELEDDSSILTEPLILKCFNQAREHKSETQTSIQKKRNDSRNR